MPPLPATSTATPIGKRPEAGVVASIAVLSHATRAPTVSTAALQHSCGGELDRAALGRGVGGDAEDAADNQRVARGRSDYTSTAAIRFDGLW